MSTALTNASRLKPEIRLAQAVSQFEADLSSDGESGGEGNSTEKSSEEEKL